MSIKPANKHMKHLERTNILLTLVVLTFAPSVYGGVTHNGVEIAGFLADAGRLLIVEGRLFNVTFPVECTTGQKDYIRVTVTQRTTGARAEGRTRITCIGGSAQQFEILAATQGKERFEEGDAISVVLLRSTSRGVTDDAHQWLVPITLVQE
ncbi:MAG: hypothetical protein ACT4QB_09105 [Gammaproteobacteria bacterium]